MKIITCNMLNGGCGKSSVVLNLSQALREQGAKVLEIDFDYNQSLTHTHRITPQATKTFFTTFELFTMPNIDIKQFIYNDVIPSNPNNRALDFLLNDKEDKEHILKRALEPLKNTYDYILIDTHNVMDITTINALSCSDIIIMPMTNDVDCVQGLNNLIKSSKAIQQRYNNKLNQYYVLMTMYQNRQLDKATLQYCEKLKTKVGFDILPNIRNDVRIAKAKANYTNIFDYCRQYEKGKQSNGAKDYLQVAQIIIGGGK